MLSVQPVGRMDLVEQRCSAIQYSIGTVVDLVGRVVVLTIGRAGLVEMDEALCSRSCSLLGSVCLQVLVATNLVIMGMGLLQYLCLSELHLLLQTPIIIHIECIQWWRLLWYACKINLYYKFLHKVLPLTALLTNGAGVFCHQFATCRLARLFFGERPQLKIYDLLTTYTFINPTDHLSFVVHTSQRPANTRPIHSNTD
jgi:hypothetical protein